MDFLDPAKRQAHMRRLFIGYFLVGIAIALASTILVILSNGYDVDRQTGKVIQNGLIFTASAPDNSAIYLNGKQQGNTDKRLTVPAGKYDVELRRNGYDSWKKTITLDGGSIERLVYPRLFPTKLVTAQSKEYVGAPGFSTQSPDRRWILVTKPESLSNIDVFDTENIDQAPLEIVLPTGVLTPSPVGQPESLTLVEWSTDNRHVLVKHTYGAAFEFIVIDRQVVASSVNINNLLAIQPTTVTLRDKRFDKLYIHTESTKELQTADTKTKLISPAVSNVTSFKPYADKTVLFSTEDSAIPGKATVKMLDDGKIYTIKSFTAGNVHLDLASFDGTMYVVAAPVNEGRMYIFKDPLARLKKSPKVDISPFSLMKIANPTKLSFSTNTRFVGIQSGPTFAVYDFEDNRRFNFTAPGTVAADQFATWMDGHRLMLNQDSSVVVVEFDGSNRRVLSSILPGMLPYFDRDYERLFTLAPLKADPAKSEMLRTSLKVNLKP